MILPPPPELHEWDHLPGEVIRGVEQYCGAFPPVILRAGLDGLGKLKPGVVDQNVRLRSHSVDDCGNQSAACFRVG